MAKRESPAARVRRVGKNAPTADEKDEKARDARIASRARDAKTKAQRVRFCAGMMSRGEWFGFITRDVLSAVWGVGDGAVRNYAAEAHRVVELDEDDKRQLQRSLSAVAQRLLRKTESDVNHAIGKPDYRDAIAALDAVAKFSGIDLADLNPPPTAPPKIEIVLAVEPESHADRPLEVPGADPSKQGAPTG